MLIKIGLAAALSLLALIAHASPSALPSSSILISTTNSDFINTDPYEQQREIYIQAKQALKSRHYKKFNKLNQKLNDYPLQPYLEYSNLTRQFKTLTQQRAIQFFEDNDQSLIGSRLRKKLIQYYAKNKRWDDLLNIYQAPQSVSLQCNYLNALIHTNNQQLAFEQVNKLWLSATSQPKSCDTVFDQWKKAGLQTADLTWQRIQLTMAKGRTKLSKYLAKSLPYDDRIWINSWINIHHRPHLAAKMKRLKSDHPMASSIRMHAIKRLSRKDPEKGIALWQTFNHEYAFSDQQTQSVYRTIGLSLAREQNPDALTWLNKVTAPYHDKYSREWMIRVALRHNDWPETIAAIEKLSSHNQNKLRWQFWWAYAHEQLGNNIDAEGVFNYLATRRDYYGFLAADHLDLPYAFENHPVELSQMEINGILLHPAALRARELIKLDKVLDARREWYSLTQSIGARQKLVASKLAEQWQWHDRAIYTMGRTTYRNDIPLRFPMPMKDKVESWSSQHNIEPALTYAIIRRESAFMSDARSHVGAMGLMQIMPRTARHVARGMRIKYNGKYSLLSADTNLKLGTSYLSQMLKKLDSQYVLATAAYNAGPHRVRSWLPESESMNAIQWIETIPFSETREYVSNVLAYTVIYQHLLHDNYTRLTNNMPPIPARNPPVKDIIMNEIALNK